MVQIIRSLIKSSYLKSRSDICRSGFYIYKKLFILRFKCVRIGAEELIIYFPFIHILSDPVIIRFIFNSWFFLGPFEQAFKIQLIAASDHNIAQFLIFNSAPDGFGINAKKFGSFRNGQANDICLHSRLLIFDHDIVDKYRISYVFILYKIGIIDIQNYEKNSLKLQKLEKAILVEFRVNFSYFSPI